MSITLKRPMFRKGGQAEEGIMELATPRRNYSKGTLQDIIAGAGLDPETQRIIETTSKISALGMPSRDDIISRALITGGLRGISETGGGSTLANLAKAFEKPVDEALKTDSMRKRADVQGALTGLGLGLKLKGQRDARKKTFAVDLPRSIISERAKSIQKGVDNRSLPGKKYADSYTVAEKIYEYTTRPDLKNKFVPIPSYQYDNKKKDFVVDPNTMQIGQVTYIPGSGLFEKVTNAVTFEEAFRPYTFEETES